jgi:hypothetical protein
MQLVATEGRCRLERTSPTLPLRAGADRRDLGHEGLAD